MCPTAATCGSLNTTRGESGPCACSLTSTWLPEDLLGGDPRLILAHVRKQDAAVDFADRVQPIEAGARIASSTSIERPGYDHLADLAPHGGRAGARAEVDAALAQRLGDLLARERLLACQQAWQRLDQRQLGAERRPRLRHLDADNAATQDHQPCRHDLRGRRLAVRPVLGLAP